MVGEYIWLYECNMKVLEQVEIYSGGSVIVESGL